MGARTKIDWCDATWNPVTGCLHGCKYCYARRIAERFKGCDTGSTYSVYCQATWRRLNPESRPEEALFEIFEKCPPVIMRFVKETRTQKACKAPYPWGFQPTLHGDLLKIPRTWKKPRTIFVCSMADLFGAWVPENWIVRVLDACRAAPQHRYLFLTKNPARYDELEDKGIIRRSDKNFWLGSTAEDMTKLLHFNSDLHTFMSCEPMTAPWPPARKPNEKSLVMGWLPEWVIFGAETGNRKGKVVPEKEWLDNAVRMCRNMGAHVFMKESLREIMGGELVRELPWETVR